MALVKALLMALISIMFLGRQNVLNYVTGNADSETNI